MTKRREKSLRDHIRVNLRKVMAEAKSMERKEAEKQAKMDAREKEARYNLLKNAFIDVIISNQKEQSYKNFKAKMIFTMKLQA